MNQAGESGILIGSVNIKINFVDNQTLVLVSRKTGLVSFLADEDLVDKSLCKSSNESVLST